MTGSGAGSKFGVRATESEAVGGEAEATTESTVGATSVKGSTVAVATEVDGVVVVVASPITNWVYR